MKVSFGEVKKVPIASVLAHYRVNVRRQGQFLVAKNCPLPTHASKDIDTFKVSLKENWWTCFSDSCRAALRKNGGDVIDFVRIMDNVDPLPAAKKLAELFCATAEDKLDTAAPDTTEATDRRNKPLKFTLNGVNPDHPMIQAKGISKETAEKWGVGYYRSRQGTASMDDRIVFPLYEDTQLVGYAGRTVLDVTPENPKWKLGKGLYKTFLYGLEKCDPARPVILVESPWAPLWFSERGQQAAAMLGRDLTEEQEKTLDPFPTIVVALDDDEKGREAAAKLCDRLRGKHKVFRSFLKE